MKAILRGYHVANDTFCYMVSVTLFHIGMLFFRVAHWVDPIFEEEGDD